MTPIMRSRLIIAGLIITSALGYLEYGTGQSTFLLTAELDILRKLFTDPKSVLHPLILLPLFGQMLLLLAMIKPLSSKKLRYSGIGCIAILHLFIFVIGIMSMKWKVFLSVVPFLALAVTAVRRGSGE